MISHKPRGIRHPTRQARGQNNSRSRCFARRKNCSALLSIRYRMARERPLAHLERVESDRRGYRLPGNSRTSAHRPMPRRSVSTAQSVTCWAYRDWKRVY